MAIRTFVEGQALLFEWTGWVEDGYFWDAGTWGSDIGFRWAYMGDTGLWAHEGAHATFGSGEDEANYFQGLCNPT